MNAFVASSSFEGRWKITEATLPNGDPGYTGTITIQRLADMFILEWDITAGKYVGLGLRLDEHLFVSCGEQYAGLGLALYQPQPDAQVSIRWCNAEMLGSIGTGNFKAAWQGTFEGNHQLVQYLPDGRLYGEWDLSIQKAGRIYELTWRKGVSIHLKGMGLDTPRGFAAGWYTDFKQLAVLDYRTDPDDAQQLKAVWALGGYTGLGIETLVRQS
jgi:hypothetical protein